MNVKTLASRLGVPARVAERAEELVKLAAAKMGTGGPGASCRSAVCLELACSAAKHFVDREQLIRLSGANKKVYLAQLGQLGGALHVRPSVDAAELGIKFGAARCVPATERCLAKYKERFVAPLERARAAAADFSRPVFVAAAFYLAARSQKVSINRPQLCAAVGIASAELSTVVAAMEELCADLLGLKPAKTAASKRKRETVASPHATSPSPRKSPRRASAAAVG